MEDLSDASFLGMLLELPANVRLDWKVIARYKHTSLFGLFVSNEEKKFYSIDTRSTDQTMMPPKPSVFNQLILVLRDLSSSKPTHWS